MNSWVTATGYGLVVILATAGVLALVSRYAGNRAVRADPGPAPRDAPRTPPPGTVAVEDSGRHHVPEELLRVATYRLNADRIARARVRAPRVRRSAAGE